MQEIQNKFVVIGWWQIRSTSAVGNKCSSVCAFPMLCWIQFFWNSTFKCISFHILAFQVCSKSPLCSSIRNLAQCCDKTNHTSKGKRCIETLLFQTSFVTSHIFKSKALKDVLTILLFVPHHHHLFSQKQLVHRDKDIFCVEMLKSVPNCKDWEDIRVGNQRKQPSSVS